MVEAVEGAVKPNKERYLGLLGYCTINHFECEYKSVEEHLVPTGVRQYTINIMPRDHCHVSGAGLALQIVFLS